MLLPRPCAAAPLPVLLLAVPPPAALRRASVPQAAAAWQETLPNALTLARVAAVPALAAAFYTPRAAAARAPAALFAACAATDWLDGYLARRWDVQSEFGAFLDPVADKLLVCTSLVLLSGAMGAAVALPTAVIVGREVGVSALREWMATTGRSDVVAVSRWGGWLGKVEGSFESS